MPALAACGAACAALLYLRALQQPRSAITRLGGAAASSPFSHVVIHGGVAYLSGVTAQADGNGLTDKDTVEEQTRRTLAVIEQRLALAGTDKSRLLSCQSALAPARPLAPALQAETPPHLAPSLAQGHRSRLQGDERRVERLGRSGTEWGRDEDHKRWGRGIPSRDGSGLPQQRERSNRRALERVRCSE